MKKRIFFALYALAVVSALPLRAIAAMSSTNYQVPWDSLGSGGDEQGSSANYTIDDTIGGIVGGGDSATYRSLAGYRSGDRGALSFVVRMAPMSGTAASYNLLSVAGKALKLMASPNPFTVGQYVAIIENPGLSQITAVGRISSVDGLDVTLDRLDGQTGSLSSVPTVGQVVLAGGGDISLGDVSATASGVATGVVSVEAGTPLGYTLYAQSAAPLASSSHTFTSVADGSVTLGAEEYGVRTYGTRASLSVDTALSTTPVSVQTSSAVTAVTGDRTAFVYRLALGPTTPAGTYSQSVFFTLTANY